MPVKIREGLPAADVLAAENVFVMTDRRAASQDIRPLSILVLNLMPAKQTTEAQILRLLGNSPLQVEVTFLHTASYSPKHTDHTHLEVFYETFERVREHSFDGLIITGAPVELMEFEDVDYWAELVGIMQWADEHVFSTLAICWGAQAELYHHYGIGKHTVDEKVFGVFSHEVTDPKNKITRGFDDVFLAPHSRHTTVSVEDILAEPDLELLAVSPEAGRLPGRLARRPPCVRDRACRVRRRDPRHRVPPRPRPPGCPSRCRATTTATTTRRSCPSSDGARTATCCSPTG